MVMRRAREWRTALVSASCAIARTSRSTPSPKRGSSSTIEVDRHAGGALAEIRQPLERRGHVVAAAGVGAQRADRSPRLGQVRAGQVDRGLDAGGDRRRQRATASRCAACSCIRIAAKPCARLSWMSRASRLRSSRMALRRSSTPVGLDEAAVVQRQRRLAGDRLDQDDPPPPVLGLDRLGAADRHPSEGAAAEQQRGRDDACRSPWRGRRPGPDRAGGHRLRGIRRSAASPARGRTGGSPCSRTGTHGFSSQTSMAGAAVAAASAAGRRRRPSTASQRCRSSSISQTAHDRLSVSSTIVLVRAPKKPSMSGSRTSRSNARLTTSPCMLARHSARRRSADSRSSAARSTSGSFESASGSHLPRSAGSQGPHPLSTGSAACCAADSTIALPGCAGLHHLTVAC